MEGRPGRPPNDATILVALWLYATIDGVGSARELDRRAIAAGIPGFDLMQRAAAAAFALLRARWWTRAWP